MRRVEVKNSILSLLETDGPMTCRDLADRIGVSVYGVTGLMRKMHYEGLVTKAKDNRKTACVWKIA